MKLKHFALQAILLASISFGGGWLYGFKRIPPSTEVGDSLLGYTKDDLQIRRNSRYDIFRLSAPKPDVIFLGDSITEAGLFNEFFTSPAKIHTRGVSADTSSDIISRLEEVINLKPDTVFLMVGINDLNRGSSPIEIANNIKNIHDRLSEAGINVFIQKTIQCHPSRCSVTKKVNQLNEILSSSYKSSKIIDLGNLNSTNGLSSELTTDGIHLSRKGYEEWLKHLRQNTNGIFR